MLRVIINSTEDQVEQKQMQNGISMRLKDEQVGLEFTHSMGLREE